jgi:hypothetical protein
VPLFIEEEPKEVGRGESAGVSVTVMMVAMAAFASVVYVGFMVLVVATLVVVIGLHSS